MSPHSKGNLNDLPTADKSLRIATSIKKTPFYQWRFFYACQFSMRIISYASSP